MHPTGAGPEMTVMAVWQVPLRARGIQPRWQLGNAPPILFLFLTKRERAVHGPREKNATAGRSAQARTLLRRRRKVGFTSRWCGRNEFPLGNPLARGTLGYPLLLAPLPLPWQLRGPVFYRGPGRFAAGPGFTVRFLLWTKTLSTFLLPSLWPPESEANRAVPRVPG